jgi:hypothetical protein
LWTLPGVLLLQTRCTLPLLRAPGAENLKRCLLAAATVTTLPRSLPPHAAPQFQEVTAASRIFTLPLFPPARRRLGMCTAEERERGVLVCRGELRQAAARPATDCRPHRRSAQPLATGGGRAATRTRVPQGGRLSAPDPPLAAETSASPCAVIPSKKSPKNTIKNLGDHARGLFAFCFSKTFSEVSRDEVRPRATSKSCPRISSEGLRVRGGCAVRRRACRMMAPLARRGRCGGCRVLRVAAGPLSRASLRHAEERAGGALSAMPLRRNTRVIRTDAAARCGLFCGQTQGRRQRGR